MKTVVKWEAPFLERFIAHEARKYTRHGGDGRFPSAGRERDAPLFSSLVDSERGTPVGARERFCAAGELQPLRCWPRMNCATWAVGQPVEFPLRAVTKGCPARQMGERTTATCTHSHAHTSASADYLCIRIEHGAHVHPTSFAALFPTRSIIYCCRGKHVHAFF